MDHVIKCEITLSRGADGNLIVDNFADAFPANHPYIFSFWRVLVNGRDETHIVTIYERIDALFFGVTTRSCTDGAAKPIALAFARAMATGAAEDNLSFIDESNTSGGGFLTIYRLLLALE
ncbi:MAG: hypothetical protein LBB38_03790 [Puniceicoccales bacterium]|jgi:hypothetical protein|nr:hypothetical protein [Puniceicoccales bacterium]